MLDHPSETLPKRRSASPPFPRVLCAIDGGEGTEAAIEQALAIAGADSRVMFAANWYGNGTPDGGMLASDSAKAMVERAVERAREARVSAVWQLFHAPTLGEALMRVTTMHDLIVVGAHPHTRATGIVMGELATLLVHRSPIPVLVARELPLAAGVVAATRGLPADRHALTTAAHLAARLGAELTVVHVTGREDERRRPELHAELANARALLGRGLDYVEESGSPARAITAVTERDGAGLVVLGNSGRTGLSALGSVSERVAHAVPCSVLVMREP